MYLTIYSDRGLGLGQRASEPVYSTIYRDKGLLGQRDSEPVYSIIYRDRGLGLVKRDSQPVYSTI